jgi:hypothetical protein
MRAARDIVVQRWSSRSARWGSRAGVLLLAIGLISDLQLMKDIGFGLIVATTIFDVATRGKDYARIVRAQLDRAKRSR